MPKSGEDNIQMKRSPEKERAQYSGAETRAKTKEKKEQSGLLQKFQVIKKFIGRCPYGKNTSEN